MQQEPIIERVRCRQCGAIRFPAAEMLVPTMVGLPEGSHVFLGTNLHDSSKEICDASRQLPVMATNTGTGWSYAVSSLI